MSGSGVGFELGFGFEGSGSGNDRVTSFALPALQLQYYRVSVVIMSSSGHLSKHPQFKVSSMTW